jgi:hypothetical protein
MALPPWEGRLVEDVWERLSSTASDSLGWLWYEFAKQGEESAVLAPLASFVTAAAWLSESLSMSDYSIHRKLGAMLAGFIDDRQKTGILVRLLEREQGIYTLSPLDSNSVGEDIMFAATRWSNSRHDEVREAGIEVLRRMVDDALQQIPWNTASWAAANLYLATQGEDKLIERLTNATEAQLEGKEFLTTFATSLRTKDPSRIRQFATPASPVLTLARDDSRYEKASKLWAAAAEAEKSSA